MFIPGTFINYLLNRLGGVVSDRFLKIYDVRMLRSLSPVSVVGEPFLLRFLPAFSSQLAVISAMGQLQVLDAAAPSSSALQLFQVNSEGAMCMALEVSSSCQCLAVGDAGGYVHTFASNTSALFNSFSRPTEFSDPVEPLPVSIPMDDTTAPLTSIPFPLEHPSPLLSDWPEQFTRRRYRKVPPIDHSIIANMRMVGTIGYAPSPPGHRPNQVTYSAEKRAQRGRKHSGADSTHSKGAIQTSSKNYFQDLTMALFLQRKRNAVKYGSVIVTSRCDTPREAWMKMSWLVIILHPSVGWITHFHTHTPILCYR